AEEKLLGSLEALPLEERERDWIEQSLRARRHRRRGARRRPAGGELRRVAPLPRGARGATAARADLRGPALGRRRPARLRRRARRLDRGRAGARALYCAARAARAATGLGRRQAERAHDLALAAVRGGHRPADRPAARAAATAGRRAGRAAGADRRQPALRGTVRPRRRRARGERAPETLHGIIAARLDSLTQGEKALLQDAAVFGPVFWGGAFGAGAELDTQLQQLVRKEFIRRERRSVVAGEAEFSFAHALMREVAYGQIPRAQRAERHEAAAAWIEA